MPRRSPTLLFVHVVWATSRREAVLSDALERRVRAIVARKASELRCSAIAVGCATDHVHVVARFPARVALADLVQRMKGGSAHEINHDDPTRPRFAWQDGYWAESLNPFDLVQTIRYVERQREHHDASHPAEHWQLAHPR